MIRRLESPEMTFDAGAGAIAISFHVIGSTYGPVEVVLTPTEARSLADHLHVYYEAASRA